MTMKHAYQALLRLYPADYKASFATEMLNAFGEAAEECRPQGRLRFVRFASAELIDLMVGAAKEWISKWTTDSSVRGRSLPDLRMMRPPRVPQRLWFAGACMGEDQSGVQHEVVEAEEKRIEIIIGRMVRAIANQDFANARLYSYQERGAREHLRRLRKGHNIHASCGTMPPVD